MMDEKKENKYFSNAKDTIIFFAWIISLLLFAGACWMLTQPVRNHFLVLAVNRVLEQSGDTRRLEAQYVPGISGSFSIGTWYTMSLARQAGIYDSKNFSAGTKAFVFSFIGEGAFFPCAAVVSADGKVEEFIPLSSHGERVLKRISPGILRLYAMRIEGVKQ